MKLSNLCVTCGGEWARGGAARGAARRQVVTYPSKSEGMFVPESLIFRSDSNGEDLAGYAGAGLYDSITLEASSLKKVQYTTDRCDHPPERVCTGPANLSGHL